ncbi:hypothetical protein [Methylocaldum gracile]|jgi:3-methyladenine DNA glycosylase AlkC|uniref:hypothetical protein n=1 Tax=Methylocaldum sp. 0917 TaxID=2485163 RepID=UPI00105BBE38
MKKLMLVSVLVLSSGCAAQRLPTRADLERPAMNRCDYVLGIDKHPEEKGTREYRECVADTMDDMYRDAMQAVATEQQQRSQFARDYLIIQQMNRPQEITVHHRPFPF